MQHVRHIFRGWVPNVLEAGRMEDEQHTLHTIATVSSQPSAADAKMWTPPQNVWFASVPASALVSVFLGKIAPNKYRVSSPTVLVFLNTGVRPTKLPLSINHSVPYRHRSL